MPDEVINHIYAEYILAVPPSAQAFYVALMQAYVGTGGAVEVFTQKMLDGESSLRIRPSNVHGHLEVLFASDGTVKDVLWDGCTGPPPRTGDRKT